MHRNRFFGWSSRIMEPLSQTPDDGAGGGDGGDDAGFTGEHPDFAFPGGGNAGDDGGGDPARAPAAAAAGRPAAPNAGGGEGDPAGRPGGQPHGTTEMVPGYRLEEVVGQRNELQKRIDAIEAENKRFKSLIAGSLGITDPNDPNPKPLDARQQQIADRILELLPWLKDLKGLAGKVESLNGLADSVPDFQRQNQAYWKRLAVRMMSGVEEAIAPVLLGEGKKPSDLAQATKDRYRADFIRWVQADEKKVDRYEGGDLTLIDDYRKELDAELAPTRRATGAAALAAGRKRATLPVAGTGTAPIGQAPKKPESLDEDSAAQAAWDRLKELTTAGS